MREIKFRGKSKFKDVWHYGSLINNAFFLRSDDSAIPYILDTDDIDYDNFVDIAEQLDDFEVIPESVGMYSGLKDKNDKEIYEANIGWDEHHERYGVVKFDEGKFLYEWENISEDLFEVCDEIEVVGNVFEHSHLLEQHHD